MARPLRDIEPTGTKIALCLHRADIGGRLFLYDTFRISGQIRMLYAHCGILADDATMAPPDAKAVLSNRLVITGFTYDRFYRDVPIDAQSRINWLDQQGNDALADAFQPQPWEQLAKVLRSHGQFEAAKVVAVEQ
jgi:hypothetical protein